VQAGFADAGGDGLGGAVAQADEVGEAVAVGDDRGAQLDLDAGVPGQDGAVAEGGPGAAQDHGDDRHAGLAGEAEGAELERAQADLAAEGALGEDDDALALLQAVGEVGEAAERAVGRPGDR
jgi:hypothetical protein